MWRSLGSFPCVSCVHTVPLDHHDIILCCEQWSWRRASGVVDRNDVATRSHARPQRRWYRSESSAEIRRSRGHQHILARLIDAQQEALAEMYATDIGDVDAAFGRLDESFFLLSMTKGREQAWRVAVVLTDVGISLSAYYARWVLRATATGGVYFILGPRHDTGLHRKLRAVEAEGFDLDTILDRVHERIDEVA
ncbi:MAG: DUF5995 family protein [Halodesulfurarchaeum sp.]